MSTFTEYRVTNVEASGSIDDLGAAVARSMPSHNRHRYIRNILYTLEDGRKIFGKARGLTKPKLAASIARDAELVKDGGLFVTFHDGVFWGTVRKMTIGASES